MIEHLTDLRRPKRVVVAGAGGFVGAAIAQRLERDGVPVLRLTREHLDLTGADAEATLVALLKSGDVFVAAAAKAPCKDADSLVANMQVARNLARALRRARDLVHVVNISSDAVYGDSTAPLTEKSPTAPTSLHGAMHLAREFVFKTDVKAALISLRPTLIYGAADPHGGYGPNSFRRLAAEGKPIVLFGEGEERRDHVYVDDVAEIAAQCIYRRSSGALNVASGEVHTFKSIAEKVAALSGNKAVTVSGSPRVGPMPHGGYRAFDVTVLKKAFPEIKLTALADGLKKAQGK